MVLGKHLILRNVLLLAHRPCSVLLLLLSQFLHYFSVLLEFFYHGQVVLIAVDETRKVRIVLYRHLQAQLTGYEGVMN
jgi:hypothetical protein